MNENNELGKINFSEKKSIKKYFYNDLTVYARYHAELLMEYLEGETKGIHFKPNIEPTKLSISNAYFPILFSLETETQKNVIYEERPKDFPIFLPDRIIACLATVDTVFREKVIKEQHLYFAGIEWIYSLLQQIDNRVNKEMLTNTIIMLSGIGLVYYFDIPFKYYNLHPNDMVFRLNGWGKKYYISSLADKKEIREQTDKLRTILTKEIETKRAQYRQVYEILKSNSTEKFDIIKRYYASNKLILPIVI